MANRFLKSLKLLLVCFLSTLFIVCCSLLWPRVLYQEGITQLKLKNFEKAVACFKKAEKAMPESISPWFARADLFRIYTNHGQALYHLGANNWKEKGLSIPVYGLLIRSKYYLTQASTIEPAHYINAYWLTQTEEGLEKAHTWLYPKKNNPFNATPYYGTALSLRPSGITVRYAFLKYLQYKGLYSKIPELVQYMMKIHPPTYRLLKKEPFYTRDLIPYVEKGLHLAVEDETLSRDALGALSDIYFNQNDFKRAISHYNALLEHKPFLNGSNEYIHMASLYLKAQQIENYYKFFEQALLESENTQSTIHRIYGIFKREKLFAEFIGLYVHLQAKEMKILGLEMAVAKTWMDMGKPALARSRLTRINADHPLAPAYYLLAKIAQKEKNWDQMERSIQKATRLDPSNPGYYYLLSQALHYQKKYIHAEEAATKAIQHAPRENPWYFNYRAWIRWSQKKYGQAAADWEKAFAIKPDRSDFPYRIALAHEQEGKFEQGLAYIQKAIALDPDNPKYKDLQTRLSTHK
jgi:tetratricopeptide (TPR) repeat protein